MPTLERRPMFDPETIKGLKDSIIVDALACELCRSTLEA